MVETIDEQQALAVWKAEAERSKLLIATVPGRTDWPATQAVIRAMLAFRDAQPVEGKLRQAVEWFIADYDDGDRADAGNGPLLELHVADFRDALSTPQQRPEQEPVAVIGKDWSLLWASPDTLSQIVARTGI